MPPVGETLREARMRQGFDIADVEQRTKIRAKYLRALENEEWGLLPGPTFVRTFLRTYAEAVGLDPHVLVDAYRTTNEDTEPEAGPPAPSRSPGRSRPPGPDRTRVRTPGPPSPPVLIGVAVVAVILFLIVLGLVGGGGSSSNKGDQASKNSRTKASKTTPSKAKPRRARRPRVTGVTVRITPSVATYACLDTGQGTQPVFEGTLSKARTFHDSTELRVNLGKRSVKLTANGKVVSITQTAQPYGLQVTKTSTQEITNGTRPCG